MKTKVLVLGTGFAAISCIKALKKKIDSHLLEVSMVGEENYTVFQPMLPEVAAGTIEASHIITSVRSIAKQIHFYRATVKEIDTEGKKVNIIGNDVKEPLELTYDHLIIALGLGNDFSKVPGMSNHSHAFKNLGDAFFLKNEVINKMEEAAMTQDKVLQKTLLTFVVIGGGFSGVETAGQLNDLLKTAVKQYPNLDPQDLKVVLIHSRERVLKELSESLGFYTETKLRDRGLDIRLNVRVKEIYQDKVLLSDGSEVFSKTVVNTTGNAPHMVISKLSCSNDKGRLETNEYFQVLEDSKVLPNLWAIGDCAFVPDITQKPAGICPPTAQYATRQGVVCAKNILRHLSGKALRPFKFRLLGKLAVIGHRVGVAEIFNFRFSGFVAFFIWRLIYWSKLPSLNNKYRVALDWLIAVFLAPDTAQINVFRTASVMRAHFPKGSFICKQGDIPDFYYILEKGKLAVLRNNENQEQQQVAILNEGDSFGEMGLIEKIPRQASIQCLTAVEVLKVSDVDFQAIIGSHSKFKKDMEAKIEGIKQQNKKLG